MKFKSPEKPFYVGEEPYVNTNDTQFHKGVTKKMRRKLRTV